MQHEFSKLITRKHLHSQKEEQSKGNQKKNLLSFVLVLSFCFRLVNSMACQAGGKNPVWNEEHAFEISSEKEAMIQILDKENVGQDKFMGELKVIAVRCNESI